MDVWLVDQFTWTLLRKVAQCEINECKNGGYQQKTWGRPSKMGHWRRTHWFWGHLQPIPALPVLGLRLAPGGNFHPDSVVGIGPDQDICLQSDSHPIRSDWNAHHHMPSCVWSWLAKAYVHRIEYRFKIQGAFLMKLEPQGLPGTRIVWLFLVLNHPFCMCCYAVPWKKQLPLAISCHSQMIHGAPIFNIYQHRPQTCPVFVVLRHPSVSESKNGG